MIYLTQDQITLVFIGGFIFGSLLSSATWRLFCYIRSLVLIDRAFKLVKKGTMSAEEYRAILDEFKK